MARDQKVKVRIQATDEASSQVKKVESSFGKLSSFLASRFVITLGDVTRAVRAAGDAIRESLDLAAQERVLRTQLEAAGQSFDQFIAKSKEAANQTLSTADIIKNATRAKLLGVGFEDMIELLEIARVSAIATGDTVGKAFEDITVGVARQSKMILDNLGFVIDLGSAYEKMADQLGKSSDTLTETERKQALLNEVMEQGRERVQAFGDAAGGLKEKLEQAEAGIVDITNELKDLIRAFGEGATSSIEASDGLQKIVDRLQSLEPIVRTAGALYAAFIGNLAESLSVSTAIGKTLGELPEILDKVGKSADTAADSAAKLPPQLDTIGDSAEKSKQELEKLREELNAQAEAYARAIESARVFGEVTSVQLQAQIFEINQALSDQRQILGETSPEYQRLAEVADQKIALLQKRIENLRDGLGDLKTNTQEIVSTMGSYATSTDQATRSTEQFTRATRASATAIQQQAAAAEQASRIRTPGVHGSRLSTPAGGRHFDPEVRHYIDPQGGVVFI